jgi:hypothetical protein
MAEFLNFERFVRMPLLNRDLTLSRDAASEFRRLQREVGGAVAAVDVSFNPVPGLTSTNLQDVAAELELEKADATTTTAALAGKQPLDATLTALAGVATVADRLVYATGVDAFAVTPFTAFARTLVDDVDAATMRGTLGAEVAGAGAAAVAAHVALADPHTQYALDTDLAALVPNTRTVNGHALSANVTVTAADVGAPSGSGTSSGANTGDQFTAQAASTLLGRGSAAGAGAAQTITLGTGLTMTGTTLSASGGAGSGDVVGPASAVNLNVALFDGVTGKLLKDAGAALNATGVGLASVTNDAQTKAAIVPNTPPAAGQVLVGNAGGTAYAPVGMSGDATLASTGALTLSGRRRLANVTLGSAGTSLASGTITACQFLEIHIWIEGYAGSDTASLQFNGAAGTAYRYRWLTCAAAATVFSAGNVAASTDRIKVDAANTTLSRRIVAFISNDASVTEKLVRFESVFGTGSAATQAAITLGNGAWVSGAATQITAVALVSTSNMLAGTQMTIFGWN